MCFRKICMVGVCVAIGMVAISPEARAQSITTKVGGINGTPIGTPGKNVLLGVSLSYSGSLGRYYAHQGPVQVYVYENGRWNYRFTVNPAGYNADGYGNSYAAYYYWLTVPSIWRRNTYLQVKYVYNGNTWYRPSVGYGIAYIR